VKRQRLGRIGNPDNTRSQWCIMTTNWSQEQYDCSTHADQESEWTQVVHPKSLVPSPTSRIEHPATNRADAESPPSAGHARLKRWFVGWDIILAGLAGVLVFFILTFVSIGVLGSALSVAGILAAVGLGHYLVWGGVFARGVARERQVQEQAARLDTRETGPADEFPLGLNDRERRELLRLLEHSLAAATEVRVGSEDGAAIRRGVQEKLRTFGA
jgi:hypothetical protein